MQIQMLDEAKNLLRKNELNNDMDIQIENVKLEFGNIVRNIVDRGADYVIKAMPINDHIKDILSDVKNSFKTKGFKDLVKTAVNSSIREGLEILSLPKNVISNIDKVKDIAIKGGLTNAICAGIEIVLKKNLNINTDIVKDFIDKMKGFINNKAFINKIDQGIKKCSSRVDKFEKMCDEWYQAYREFDLDKINQISSKLNNSVKNVKFNKDSVKSNNIIQNLTEFVNNKKDRLTEMQYQACMLV